MSQLKKSLEEMKNKTKGLDKTVKDTQTSVDNMSKSAVSGMNSTKAATEKTRAEMQKLTQDVNKLLESMTKGSKNKLLEIDLSETKQELADTENLIKELYAELDSKQMKLDAGVSGEEYKQLLADIASLNGQLDDAEDEAQRLKAQLIMGDEGVVKTTGEIEEMKRELLKVSEALTKAKSDLAQMANQDLGSDETQEQVRLVGQLESQYRKLSAIINHASAEANKPIVEPKAPSIPLWLKFYNVINRVKKAVSDLWAKFNYTTFGKVTVGLTKAFVGIATHIGKAGLAMSKFVAKMNPMPKLVDKLGRAWKSLREKIIAAFVYSAINTWFNNIRNQITSYLKVNNDLQNALNRNTGAWLTAFQPIYEVVVPALVTLLNWLTKVGYAFARFTSQLTGKTVAESQASAEALYNQASALEATGAAAEEARRQLMGFDELNVVSKDNSGGGGGSASTESKPEFGEIPDTTKFNSWGEAFSSLLDKLIAKLPSFEKACLKAADAINKFSANLLEMFTYDGVQDKVATLATGLANSLNKLVDAVDWNQLGQAFGAGIQTALNFLHSFLFTFDWVKLGSSFSSLINGLLKQIDGYKLGELLVAPFKIGLDFLVGFITTFDFGQFATKLSQCIKGALDRVSQTLQNTDWGKVGSAIINGIFDFLKNFDWAGTFTSLFSAVGSILGASARLITTIASGIGEVIGKGVENAKNYFKKKIEECGGNVVEGIFKGIKDAILGIGTWIKNNIFQPFIDGFKKAFGIHSPSTVMAEQGKYIIEGLLQGIQNAWKTVASWISGAFSDLMKWCSDTWTSIKSTATEKWNSIKTTVTDTATKIKNEVGQKWEQLKTSVTTTVTNLKSTVEQKWNNLKQTVTTTITNLKDEAEKKWETLKTNLGTKMENLKKDITDKWETTKTNVTTKIEELKTSAEQKWETLKTNLATKMNNIKTDIETKWSNIKSNTATAVQQLKSDVETKWENMKNTVGSKMDSFKANLSTKWNNIKTDATTKASEIKSKVETTFENMKTGVVNIFSRIGTALKTPINAIISIVNSMLSLVTNGINRVIDIINSVKFTIPTNDVTEFFGIAGKGWNGFNISHVRAYQIPMLANGAIVTQPTMAMVGEAGREAVLPLENNTGWMDMLAEKLASRMTTPTKVVLQVGEKELGWATINSINGITKQTGGLQLVL